MADPSLFSVEIARAVPVIIGGLLAAGGGIAAQVITHRLAGSREQHTLRRERLESFVRALYAHEQWIEQKRNLVIFRNENHDTPSPLDEARMIQALHFPELLKESIAVQEATAPLLKFINEQRLARMKDEKTWINDWNFEPYGEAYERYLTAVRAATAKCRKLFGVHWLEDGRAAGTTRLPMAKRLGGWWRLWIALAACYTAGVSIIAWNTWPQPTDVSDQQVLERVPNDTLLLVLPDLTKDAPPASIAKLQLDYGRTVDVDGATTVAQRELVARGFNDALLAALREWRTGLALTFLAVWLVPLLAVVALGFLINWVYRGFKDRPEAS